MTKIELSDDELVLNIQIVLSYVVAAERIKPTEQGQPLPAANALLQRLHEAREASAMSKPIPAVDHADIRIMWDYSKEVLAEHPGATSVAVGTAVWKNLCSPGADIEAVAYRCGILMLLRSLWVGGEPSENAFKVAARMGMQKPPIGVVQNGLFYDVEQFIGEVQLGIGC